MHNKGSNSLLARAQASCKLLHTSCRCRPEGLRVRVQKHLVCLWRQGSCIMHPSRVCIARPPRHILASWRHRSHLDESPCYSAFASGSRRVHPMASTRPESSLSTVSSAMQLWHQLMVVVQLELRLWRYALHHSVRARFLAARRCTI